MRADERLEEGREEVDEGLRRRRRVHLAGERRRRVDAPFAERLDVGEDAGGMPERALAVVSQPDHPPAANEQRLTQLSLERADLAAYGRLGQIEPLSGPREAQRLGDGSKCPQLRELHARSSDSGSRRLGVARDSTAECRTCQVMIGQHTRAVPIALGQARSARL